jgi:hypothetical protein
MRRILAITLLIAIGSGLVAPVFAATANPQASLPACCRRHGKHHCSMMNLSGSASDPTFQAPPCPSYPAAAAPLQLITALLAAPLPQSAEIRREATPRVASLLLARTHAASANLKRGPPTRLA